MASKDNTLVIEAPRTGIAQSPHVGVADVRNLDIYSVPGIAQLNNILVKKSSTTVDAQVNWLARDPDTIANIGALDSNGVYYKSTDSGATWAEISDRDGAGQGLIIKWGYAFVCEVTTIDVIKLSDNTVTSNWKTIDTDSLWHPMISSKNDGKIYGGAGQYVFSIEQVAGQTFDPANSATYTFTAQALDLPTGYRIKCIEELGNNLMLGTWQGTNIYDIRVADIFPWDRSATSFGQPVVLSEFGVHAMLNIGNSLIVLAGIEGNVFRCDGVNAYTIAKLPQDLSGGKYQEWYPGSICSYKNKVFFGTGQGGTTVNGGQGIYSLQQTAQGNILNLEHLNSLLTDGSAAPVKISALLPVTKDTLLAAFRSDTTYGIDLTTATSYAYTTDYSAYFESPLYLVGSLDNKRVFTKIELLLAKELATGEGFRIKYRVNLTDSFTTLTKADGSTLALTFAALGAVHSHKFTADIPACEMIQIRVEFLGTSTTTPQFKALILS